MAAFADNRASDSAERRLFVRLCDGDLDAFDAFCRRIEGPVYTYVLRMVHNPSEAEDLAQEALFRLYRLARDGRIRVNDGSPRALVFRIAHNLTMDHFRRARRQAELPVAADRSADRSVETRLLREQIDRALAEIPESHRAAILLREFGGMSYAEIAETLEATVDQVKVWIYRARRRLAQLLDRDGQYIGGTTPAAKTAPAVAEARHGL